MTLRYVLIPKFCAESGYSEKAVRRKIEEGIWLQNRHYRRAPDGHILIDTQGVAEDRVAEPIDAPVLDSAPTCGVYLLLDAGEVVYVGRSGNVKQRLAEHRASGRMFDEARVIPCSPELSNWLEAELIRTLQPGQNLIRFRRRAELADKALRGLIL